MPKQNRRWALLTLIAFGLALIPSGPVWGRSTDEDRLARGEVLIAYQDAAKKSAVHDVQGDILCEASPPLVWWVLTDYDNWAKIFPDIAEAKVLERKDNVTRLKVRVKNLWPYPDYIYTLIVTEDRVNWSVAWNMEEGNLKTYYGSASIKYFGPDLTKTELTYLLNRDQGWFVPKSSADLDNRTLVVNQLLALRREVRRRKKALDTTTDTNIKPKWKKTPLWWDTDKTGDKDKNPEPKPSPADPDKSEAAPKK